jgi:hypothetical protein
VLCFIALGCRRPPHQQQVTAKPTPPALPVPDAGPSSKSVVCTNGRGDAVTLWDAGFDCFDGPCGDPDDFGLEPKRRSVATTIQGRALPGELPTDVVDHTLCPQLAAMSMCIEETRRGLSPLVLTWRRKSPFAPTQWSA